MDIKKGDTVKLRIEKVVYGGRGLAHLDKMAIFVERAVPGDMVAARVVRMKKNYAEARIVELREPSPHRVSPSCAYCDHCGGCTWQFVRYEKQLEYKQDFVEDLLTHMAKLSSVRLHHVLPSPDIYGYRNKMEFSFSDRRWIAPEERSQESRESHCALGLHVPGTFDKIIDIEGCLLQADRGNEILREVKGYVRDSGIPVYGLRSHQGFWRYLMLRHSYCFDEWMVNIVTSDEREEPLLGLASILRDRFREIVSIVNSINTRRGGTAVGEWQRNLLGDGSIREGIGPLTFQVSAGSFFQANTPLSQGLYQVVRDFASLTGRETVLDLYCGIGTVSAFLASQASRVIGIDISESAIADARRNCQLNGIDNCEFFCGDVKPLLSRLTTKPQVLIADPPRSGMQGKVIERILDVMPERIVYISCNPATLARDIVSLKERYHVEEVQPIDLFPHTYHIEAIARLERKRG